MKPTPSTVEVTTVDIVVGQMIIERDVPIHMSDGVVLRGNLYRPVNPGRYPLIANMGPYSKDRPMSDVYPMRWARMVQQYPDVLQESSGKYLVWEVPDPERWIPRGYALLHIDSRGTGRSPGGWNPHSSRETADFGEAIEWAAAQDWSNGRVGVMGVSYYAMAAWRVAAISPPHLTAAIPWHGVLDLYRDWSCHGGIFSNGFSDLWWYRWLMNQHGYPDGAISPYDGKRTTGPATLSESERAAQRIEYDQEVRRRPLIDDFWRERSADPTRITVPVLSVGNWGTAGLHLRGNIEGFVRAASKEKWLVMLAAKQARVERFHDQAGIALQQRFFDYYLKGLENNWPAQPRVSVEIRMPEGRRRWRTDATWPLATTRFTKFHIDANKRIMSEEAPTTPGIARYHSNSDGVTLRTTPFKHETEITGPLKLRLHVSTEKPDMDIFVIVRATHPEGQLVNYYRIYNMASTRGWLRLSHRKLDSKASTDCRPIHPHDELLPVEPGKLYEVDVEILPTSMVVPAGGRLLITIQGVDAGDTEQTRHNDPKDRRFERFAGYYSFFSGPGHDSFLLLPIIDAKGGDR